MPGPPYRHPLGAKTRAVQAISHRRGAQLAAPAAFTGPGARRSTATHSAAIQPPAPGAPERASPPGEEEPRSFVLVAGAETRTRRRMLEELRSLLPPGTEFVEADQTWEAIALAADSRMVVLAGDLGDVSADSLLRMLARRNPTLPILAAGEDRRARGDPPHPPATDERGAYRVVDAVRA